MKMQGQDVEFVRKVEAGDSTYVEGRETVVVRKQDGTEVYADMEDLDEAPNDAKQDDNERDADTSARQTRTHARDERPE